MNFKQRAFVFLAHEIMNAAMDRRYPRQATPTCRTQKRKRREGLLIRSIVVVEDHLPAKPRTKPEAFMLSAMRSRFVLSCWFRSFNADEAAALPELRAV